MPLWRHPGFLITALALAIALMAPSWLDRQKSNPFGELTDEIAITKDITSDDTGSGAGDGTAHLALLLAIGIPTLFFTRQAVRKTFPRSAALAPKPAAFIVPLANGPPSPRG